MAKQLRLRFHPCPSDAVELIGPFVTATSIRAHSLNDAVRADTPITLIESRVLLDYE